MSEHRAQFFTLGRLFILLAVVPLLGAFDPFRSANGDVEAGNDKLANGKLEEALEHYESASKALPDEPGVHYNRGVALFKLGRHDEARQALLKASVARAPGLRGRAFYSLGNALFKLEKYEEAVQAYTRALQQNSRDKAAKWNLELALRRLEEKKKKEQQKKKQDDKKKKDDKKQQKKDDKQQKKQESKDDKKQQKKPGQQKKDDQQQKQQQKKKKPGDQRKKQQAPRKADEQQRKAQKPEMRRLNKVLDALDRNDKNLQRRRARMLRGGYRKPSKDW